MRLGINTFLFTSPFTNESTSLFSKFKKWGFETVEIPVEDPSHIDPAHVKAELDKNGLVCGSVCACMGGGHDLRGMTGHTDQADHTAAPDHRYSLLDRLRNTCTFKDDIRTTGANDRTQARGSVLGFRIDAHICTQLDAKFTTTAFGLDEDYLAGTGRLGSLQCEQANRPATDDHRRVTQAHGRSSKRVNCDGGWFEDRGIAVIDLFRHVIQAPGIKTDRGCKTTVWGCHGTGTDGAKEGKFAVGSITVSAGAALAAGSCDTDGYTITFANV